MSGLVEFLRARYTEAREREQGKRRSVPSPFDGREVEIHISSDGGPRIVVDGHQYPPDRYFELATEPASDPAVLADLDAKFAILAEFEEVDARAKYPDFDGGTANGLDVAMQHLAVPYSGHPDYREEWKP